MRNKLSLRREAQPHRGDAPLTPNGKPETFLASWVGDTIVANPGRACTNAAKPPLRPRFCTFSTSKPATFENVTVLHDTKPTFTFSNPRLLLQAAHAVMRRERDIQAGTCHHLAARVAKGESKGARRYDKESLLWQSTMAVKSDHVGPVLK